MKTLSILLCVSFVSVIGGSVGCLEEDPNPTDDTSTADSLLVPDNLLGVWMVNDGCTPQCELSPVSKGVDCSGDGEEDTTVFIDELIQIHADGRIAAYDRVAGFSGDFELCESMPPEGHVFYCETAFPGLITSISSTEMTMINVQDPEDNDFGGTILYELDGDVLTVTPSELPDEFSTLVRVTEADIAGAVDDCAVRELIEN